jgi:hypothetical protein
MSGGSAAADFEKGREIEMGTHPSMLDIALEIKNDRMTQIPNVIVPGVARLCPLCNVSRS